MYAGPGAQKRTGMAHLTIGGCAERPEATGATPNDIAIALAASQPDSDDEPDFDEEPDWATGMAAALEAGSREIERQARRRAAGRWSTPGEGPASVMRRARHTPLPPNRRSSGAHLDSVLERAVLAAHTGLFDALVPPSEHDTARVREIRRQVHEEVARSPPRFMGIAFTFEGPSASAPPPPPSVDSVIAKLNTADDKSTEDEAVQCTICSDHARAVMLTPCGHYRTCRTCTILSHDKRPPGRQFCCPHCRAPVACATVVVE